MAAESEVTSDADDPRPVLLVEVIAFGRGENGSNVVFVWGEGMSQLVPYQIGNVLLSGEFPAQGRGHTLSDWE